MSASQRGGERLEITIHPDEVERHRRKRAYRLNVWQIPALRLLGFVLLSLGVWVHNRYLLADPRHSGVAAGIAVLVGYALASWALVAALWGRTGRFDLGLFFLVVDLWMWCYAIYLAGADRSLIFFVPIIRVIDQTQVSFRRAMWFTHLGVAAYFSMIGWVAVVEGRAVDWRAEAAKGAFIYGASFYTALTARTAEERQRRTTAAIRLARESIAEIERARAELVGAKEAAEQGSRAKSQFLATMSHELRTPLNAIIGYTEMLLEEVAAAGAGDLVPDLERINAAGRHLLQLVSDVLEIARLEGGRSELNVEAFAMSTLVAEVADSLEPEADRRGLSLTVVADEAGEVRSDRGKLRQVLMHLAGNALKFTEKGGVELRARRLPAHGQERLLVSVRDTGIGMSEAEVAGLFQPFSQADASPTRRHGGSGLGLMLSRRLVELLGGTISVTSAPGVGSTFLVDLPAETAADAVARRFADTVAVGLHSGNAPLLLGIAPDPATRDMLVRMLGREGYQVVTAWSADEGLRLAGILHPAAVLVTVGREETQGWQLVQRLRALPEAAPVIVIGGEGERERAIAAGAAAAVAQPLERHELTDAVRRSAGDPWRH